MNILGLGPGSLVSKADDLAILATDATTQSRRRSDVVVGCLVPNVYTGLVTSRLLNSAVSNGGTAQARRGHGTLPNTWVEDEALAGVLLIAGGSLVTGALARRRRRSHLE